MSIVESIKGFFRRKPKEPVLEDVKFSNYVDFHGHFTIFYPVKWKYDPPVVVDQGMYAVVFHSDKSQASFRVEVSTILPLEFDLRKYAKNEIEKPSAGVVAKAYKSKFANYPCYQADYEYESGGRTFIGKKMIFYTGDRVFSIFYTCPAEEAVNLKKIFSYMADSIMIRPAKTKIFKRPLQ